MENVTFEFEVVDAAKAHVGKRLELMHARIQDAGLGQTIAFGTVVYNGINYAAYCSEFRGITILELQGRNRRSRLYFSQIKFL